MPFKIQRVPRGLNDLLSSFGGVTPSELEDRCRATLELIQFYGLTQRQVIFRNEAAIAQLGTAAISSADPAIVLRPAILFAAEATIGRTATMTALRFSIKVSRAGGNNVTVAHGIGNPFAATDLGNSVVPFVAPFPWFLPPPWDVRLFLNTLGTDATANGTILAELGILG